MCLWLITACLGMLPANPSQQNIVVVQGVPSTILQPTTAATTTTTTARPAPPPPGITTAPTVAPTVAPTMAPTMAPPRPTPTPGGVLLPVILCNNPDVVCISNPDENDTGPLLIDPRLGTTPSAPLQLPPITGYSVRVPSFDMAVKFPRQRRDLDDNKMNIRDFLNGLQYEVKKKHEVKRQSCSCVTNGMCFGGWGTNAAIGMIDFRIVTPGGGNAPGQCPAGQVYCCGTSASQIACGSLQTVPGIAITLNAGQANFGEFPWQALILTQQNDYIAGGVLIDSKNVLTVTHRLLPYIVSGTAPNVKVRLGEWDAAGTYEPVPFQEYTVQKVFSHPSYNGNTLQFDIMLLRLSSAVPLAPATGSAPTINRACLPPSSTTTYTGQNCLVAGWGQDMFGVQGQYQQILKKVEVPIVPPATCQTQLQTARLGPTYVLDTTSFVCAGGVANKDACTGDGGSGLVCNVNGLWVVVGLVSWGLGCANANVPGAYVNVAALLPWIQQQVATA